MKLETFNIFIDKSKNEELIIKTLSESIYKCYKLRRLNELSYHHYIKAEYVGTVFSVIVKFKNLFDNDGNVIIYAYTYSTITQKSLPVYSQPIQHGDERLLVSSSYTLSKNIIEMANTLNSNCRFDGNIELSTNMDILDPPVNFEPIKQIHSNAQCRIQMTDCLKYINKHMIHGDYVKIVTIWEIYPNDPQYHQTLEWTFFIHSFEVTGILCYTIHCVYPDGRNATTDVISYDEVANISYEYIANIERMSSYTMGNELFKIEFLKIVQEERQ